MAETLEEYFVNDIVYRIHKRKRVEYGTVMDSYNSCCNTNLQKDEIKVWWSSASREEVLLRNKVRLLNRTITPGNIVRRLIHGQDTQRGYCKYMKHLITVQIVGTDKIIERVCNSRFKPMSKYLFDKIVSLDNQCGRIENVECKILMRAKCGSLLELSRYSLVEDILEDYWFSKRNHNYPGAYYPGQEIVCVPQTLPRANWLYCSKYMKRKMHSRMRFTIQNIEAESVNVLWFPLLESDDIKSCGKSTIEGDDIKRLKFLTDYESTYFDLDDRIFLKLSPSDKIIKKQDWLRKQTAYYKSNVPKVSSRFRISRNRHRRRSSIQLFRPPNPPPASDDEEWWTDESTSSLTCSKTTHHWPPRAKDIVPENVLAVEVLTCETKVRVAWQDGTIEEDIPATQLHYSALLPTHEFFPGDFVVAEDNKNGEEYGVIQCVDHLGRTATVKWFRTDDKNGPGSEPAYLHTSEISVYNIQLHQQYQFRAGLIIRSRNSSAEPGARIGFVRENDLEGYIRVHWIDGTETHNRPQDLTVLLNIESYVFSDSSSEHQLGSSVPESVGSPDESALEENRLAIIESNLDFIRTKMAQLIDMFKKYKNTDSILMYALLTMYDNSSYLDNLLGTSLFTRKSHHFQLLFDQVKKRGRVFDNEINERVFTTNSHQNVKIAENENTETVRYIEAVLSCESQFAESAISVEGDAHLLTDANLCVEIASMIKARMDLAYAEIISRIAGQEPQMTVTEVSESSPAPAAPNKPDVSLQHMLKRLEQVTTGEGYTILYEAPKSHYFYSTQIIPSNPATFLKAVSHEGQLLTDSLPPGIWVRGYSDRVDLLSVMIRGPSKTPYEDGLFLFDVQLGADYPHSPPSVHYISFSSERLNPNLYVEGTVCVSLLGTWIGYGSEVWGPSSSLLQLFVSIQGLILVSEPYYNETGYEKQVGSQQGYENSRTYNELVILKLVEAMSGLLKSIPEVFKNEILFHISKTGKAFCERIESWTSEDGVFCPDFPLLPATKGFLLPLQCSLASFKEICAKVIDENKKTPQNCD